MCTRFLLHQRFGRDISLSSSLHIVLLVLLVCRRLALRVDIGTVHLIAITDLGG